MLDCLIPGYFLKIFSKLEKEPLDIEASCMLFEKVAKEINTSHKERFSIGEIVYGWVWFSALIMSFLTYAAIRFIKAAGYMRLLKMDEPHQNIMSATSTSKLCHSKDPYTSTIVTLLMLPHEENGDGSDDFEATLNRTLA